MYEHSRVDSFSAIANADEYLFKILRDVDRNWKREIIVHLTDAYQYGEAGFYTRPTEIRRGSFIVLGLPHASVSREVVEVVRAEQIGVGHIGKFMGALNSENVWEYLTSEEQAERR